MTVNRLFSLPVVLGAVLMAGILVTEIFTHVLGNVAYVAVAAGTYWLSKGRNQIYFVGSFGTLVLIIGYVFAITLQEPTDQLTFFVNRVSALIAIWLAGYFTIHYQKVQTEKLRQREEIEQRKLAEERLRSSQEMHEAIAKNFPNGWIGLLNEDLRYVFADGRGLGRAGVKAGDVIRNKFTNTIRNDGIEQCLKDAQNGKSSTFEIGLNNRTFEVNASPFQGTQKQKWVLTVAHDITTLKETEAELVKALQKERELHEMKSRFVTMASHEFRTPLATIMSSAGLLDNYTNDKHSDSIHKHIARIKGSVKLLTEVLNDFLSLGRLEEGTIVPRYESIGILDFLNEVLEEMKPLTRDNLEIIVKNSIDVSIISDKDFLRIILHNLLSNAFKYSRPSNQVVIEIYPEQGRCKIKITDHGMGILPEDQEHIFERFFRGQNAMNIQGTGLGLCIARRYAKLLQGEITFSSTPEKETVFTLDVPDQCVPE